MTSFKNIKCFNFWQVLLCTRNGEKGERNGFINTVCSNVNLSVNLQFLKQQLVTNCTVSNSVSWMIIVLHVVMSLNVLNTYCVFYCPRWRYSGWGGTLLSARVMRGWLVRHIGTCFCQTDRPLNNCWVWSYMHAANAKPHTLLSYCQRMHPNHYISHCTSVRF